MGALQFEDIYPCFYLNLDLDLAPDLTAGGMCTQVHGGASQISPVMHVDKGNCSLAQL